MGKTAFRFLIFLFSERTELADQRHHRLPYCKVQSFSITEVNSSPSIRPLTLTIWPFFKFAIEELSDLMKVKSTPASELLPMWMRVWSNRSLPMPVNDALIPHTTFPLYFWSAAT